jgi:hypothetical protein
MPFTIRQRDDSSSFYTSAEEASAAGFSRVMVASSRPPVPEMVKIDAEGFDLKVLAGESDLFGKTEVFFTEATVRGPWEKTPLAVMKYMAERGYKLLDVTDFNSTAKCGLLWLVELTCVEGNSRLLDGVAYCD